ncbi:MAG: dephospho-CoA kinase [Gemmataceae bacterium]|nr:dephospho-CoA kinase [Gemmata sp.]MDW8199029.1 dephospho-CoA kinase [Gemmataceae bacterium]
MTALPRGPKPVIGLVGAIGAGKSTVARCFANRGAWVIDADALGHDALRQPEIVAALVQRWGEKIQKADGSLDRRAIARIVFADPQERNVLETIVFPYITAQMQKQIAAAQMNPQVPLIVLDAAVLLEAGWQPAIDRLVFVDAPRPLRLARLAARSGWNERDLAAREAAQWPIERKKALADAIIMNDASLPELQARVDELLARWK